MDKKHYEHLGKMSHKIMHDADNAMKGFVEHKHSQLVDKMPELHELHEMKELDEKHFRKHKL